MARQLEISIWLESRQADTALKGFINTLEKAERSFKSMQEAQRKTSASLRYMQDTLNRTSETMKKSWVDSDSTWNKIANSFWKATSAVQEFWKNLLDTTKTITKWSLATWSIISGKAFYDLKNYSEAMAFFNATIKNDSVEATKELRDEFMKTSEKIWVWVDKVILSGQRLASSGLAPSASKWTKEYQDQLQNLIKINEMVWKSAALTGSSLQETVDWYVYMSNAMGRNPASEENARYVLDMMSAIQDYGSGDLREYNAQYSKFLLLAKQLKMSDAESLWIFTRMTKTMSPMMAGHVVKSFSSDMLDMAQNAWQAANKVNFVLNKVKKGSLHLTPDELKELQRYDTTDEWNEVLYNKDANWNKVPKNLQGIMDAVRNMFKNFKTEYARDSVMSALFQNQNTRKFLLDIMVDENYKDLQWIIWNLEEKGLWTGEYLNKKWNIYEKNFWTQWNRAWESWKNFAIWALDEIAPAFWAVFQSISQALNGEGVDGGLAKWFDEARKNIEKTYPALKPVVDLLEKMFYWIKDWRAKETFQWIANILSWVATSIWIIADWFAKFQSTINYIWNLLWLTGGGKWALTIWLTIWGYALLKTMLIGLGWVMATSLTSGILTASVGTAIGTSIATTLVAFAGWAAIGAAIWAWAGYAYMKWIEKYKAAKDMNVKSIEWYNNSYANARKLRDNWMISDSEYTDLIWDLDKWKSSVYKLQSMSGDDYRRLTAKYIWKWKNVNEAYKTFLNDPSSMGNYIPEDNLASFYSEAADLKRKQWSSPWAAIRPQSWVNAYTDASMFIELANQARDQNKNGEMQVSELQKLNSSINTLIWVTQQSRNAPMSFPFYLPWWPLGASGTNLWPRIWFSN